MAQVILENLYKTFPKIERSPARSSAPGTMAAGTIAAADAATTGAQTVLRRINLSVNDGEFMVLVGPSGCGKSTLLRLIAGLEEITAGTVQVGDRRVNDLPPKERDIAMVFQSYALYPHLNVYDNLAFGLRRARPVGGSQSWLDWGRAHSERWAVAVTRSLPSGLRYWSAQERQVQQRVQEVARMLQIEALLERYPRQLSGGQKQRVALGRAMARNPQVFLMDEPLSNLDAKLRGETRSQIVNLQRQLGITTIYVTHDQVEAMTMGDRIAVMHQGQIQQVAQPLELYHRPANQFVAGFIGSPPMNFLSVQVKAPLLITHPAFRLTLPEMWAPALAPYDGQTLTLGIRPEHLSLGVAAPKNLTGIVRQVEALGCDTYLTVQSGDELLQARVEAEQAITLGATVWLAIAADRIHLFNPTTQNAIFADVYTPVT